MSEISIETLLVNNRPEILTRWDRELTPPKFLTQHAKTPLEVISRVNSKHYDLILIDLGESSVRERPYAIAYMIRDTKPGVTLVGVSGCPIIEEYPSAFDGIIIDGPNLPQRLESILRLNGVYAPETIKEKT